MPDQQISKNRKFNYGKIVIAFLIGCFTILLFLGINKTTIRQMLVTVKQLSQPDAKIQLVNNIFREVVTLDQLQRNQALQDREKTYNPFTHESAHLQLMLDTLSNMSHDNTMQVKRIASMKSILHERDKLFLNYLLVRAKLNKNDTLINQLQDLSKFITASPQKFDSGLISTQKVITTITTEHEDSSHLHDEQKQGFWNKLFGRKKPRTEKRIEKLVKEELNIKLDTVALDKKDSIVKALSKTVSIDQENRQKRRSILVGGQQQLSAENNMLIRQLLTILKDIETEETANADDDNARATKMVNADLDKMDAILILFIAATAVLVFLIINDISKSNRYRKQLVLAKEEAEELGQVKQRFLANMSHELRTPLQTIIGMAEQMKIKGFSEKTELDIFYRSSQYLLQIVNEVLDYSRITSGRFRFESKPFNMHRLVTDIHQTMQVQAMQKKLKFLLTTDINAEQNYLGDPFRLKQILYNLLGNAIKFTDTGTVTLDVAHTVLDDGDAFTFTVKDTGIGIPEEKLDKIFAEFETLNPSDVQKQKGTGLGLNIVKELVQQQDGDFTVSSTLAQGSAFAVNLVFSRTTDPEIYHPAIETTVDAFYNGTVWVVDDDKFILQLCATIFEKYHISYQCFSLPEDILSEPFDNSLKQVFLDIRLPGMSGIELCARLKKDANFSAVRFTALTAQVMQDEKDEIINSGFDALLSKPFIERELLAAVIPYLSSENELKALSDRLDFSSLYQMAGNDEELVQQAINNFLFETEKDLENLKVGIKESDHTIVSDTLHRLASRCGQMGMSQLLLVIRSMELEIRENKTLASSTKELKGLIKDIEKLTKAINDHKTPPAV